MKQCLVVSLLTLFTFGLACEQLESLRPAESMPTPNIEQTIEAGIKATTEAVASDSSQPAPTDSSDVPPTPTSASSDTTSGPSGIKPIKSSALNISTRVPMTRLVYEDKFENAALSEFRHDFLPGGPIQFVKGKLRFSAKADESIPIPVPYCGTVGETRFEDFDLRVEAISVGQRKVINSYSVIFRSTDSINGYWFSVDTSSGTFKLTSLGGGFSVLKDDTSSKAINEGGAVNSLRVVAQGSKIELFINDSSVYDTNDTTHLSGRIGLCAVTGATRESVYLFDNLEIYGPAP